MYIHKDWTIFSAINKNMANQGGPTGQDIFHHASGPQVVIGTRNAFPNMPSISQRYFFSDADADINSTQGFPENAISEGDHFEYGGPNRLGTQVNLFCFCKFGNQKFDTKKINCLSRWQWHILTLEFHNKKNIGKSRLPMPYIN
jgi:hypothetical protein